MKQITAQSGKGRPIVFTSNLLNEIVNGRKTVTRRPIRNAPQTPCVIQWLTHEPEWGVAFHNPGTGAFISRARNPFGPVGTRLWVKETWGLAGADANREYAYRARGDPRPSGGWKSPRFMPQTAARLFLENRGVSVERLQEITTDEISKEGILTMEHITLSESGEVLHHEERDVRGEFAKTWDRIYGSGSWRANPNVWRLSFTIKAVPDWLPLASQWY